MLIDRPFPLLALGVLALTDFNVFADESGTKSYPVISGVGIALREDHGELFVGAVVTDSPAYNSGRIRKGDRLVAVRADNEKILLSKMSIGEAASVIRGPTGTILVLTLVPKSMDSEIDVTLTRAPLVLEGIPDISYRSFVGKPAPDIELATLDGKITTKLSDCRGKIVVLEFWASWCPTCYAPVTKMQDIVRRNDDWDGRVEMISVSVDTDLERASAMVAKQGWDRTRNMSIEFDKLKDIGVSVVPVTIIVAMNGTIATMAESHALDVEREVKALLPAQPPRQNRGEPSDEPKSR